MTRFKIWCGAGLLLALALIGVLWLTQATAAHPPNPVPPDRTPIHSTFNITNTYVSGGPAIQTHASPNASGPAFSAADVAAFLNKYGFYAGPLVKGAHLKILTIQFVTAAQASKLMYGESVGRPDNYLVCYVKVQGPFLLTNVHAGPNMPNNHKVITTAKYGDAVFDARTGNVLVWGVYY